MKCSDKVRAAGAAIGREVSDEDLKDIQGRLAGAMRELARRDPETWRSMTANQRIAAAGELVAAEVERVATQRLRNAELQILKTSETNGRIQAIQEANAGRPGHSGTRAEALKRDIVNSHLYEGEVRRELVSGLMDTIDAAMSSEGQSLPRRVLSFVFDVENPLMTRDLIREVFANADGHTGNPLAKGGASAWLTTIAGALKRFNAAGGDVGTLDYGYIPQLWDTSRVRNAGAEGFAEAVLPHVDRRRYVREDGAMMNDEEVLTFLRKASASIATEGLNKVEPGQFRGQGKRAERRNDHRQIHFKDGDSYIAVMQQFGEGSMYDAMLRHIGGMARDIALLERYGPDPAAQARLQFDTTALADEKPVQSLSGSLSINPQTYWNILTGVTGTPVDVRIADAGFTLRSLQTAGKLGFALWSSLADLGNVVITAGYNRVPFWTLMESIAAQGGKEGREFLAVQGIISDSVASSLDRWSGDHLSQRWSGRMANATLKLSLLRAWTDGLRQGFKLSLGAKLADLVKTEWSSLTEFDRLRLTRSGITAADWEKLGAVTPAVWRGHEVLTPQAIASSGVEGSQQLAARLFGFVHDESEYAVVESDLATRAITTWGGQSAGTAAGEIARTVMQFKATPIALITRHWRRMLEGGSAEGAPILANRWAYGMALLGSGLALGAIGEQASQVLAGKDPINPVDHPKFWLKALLRGGGLGIVGDIFLTDTTDSRSPQEALGRITLGPSFGTAADVWELSKGNIDEYLAGKDTHAAAEALRLGRSLTPVNNVWWVKPALDHGLLNALNESMSPGYLQRVQDKARAQWGQRYWWALNDDLPSRPPDLGEAFGQQ
jgi:hypothetical protein